MRRGLRRSFRTCNLLSTSGGGAVVASEQEEPLRRPQPRRCQTQRKVGLSTASACQHDTHGAMATWTRQPFLFLDTMKVKLWPSELGLGNRGAGDIEVTYLQ